MDRLHFSALKGGTPSLSFLSRLNFANENHHPDKLANYCGYFLLSFPIHFILFSHVLMPNIIFNSGHFSACRPRSAASLQLPRKKHSDVPGVRPFSAPFSEKGKLRDRNSRLTVFIFYFCYNQSRGFILIIQLTGEFISLLFHYPSVSNF